MARSEICLEICLNSILIRTYWMLNHGQICTPATHILILQFSFSWLAVWN